MLNWHYATKENFLEKVKSKEKVKKMKKQLFSVFDSKAETFSAPFVSDNKSTAMREFATLVKDGRTLIGTHPNDFDLYMVGVFDSFEGTVSNVDKVHLANGSDFVAKE